MRVRMFIVFLPNLGVESVNLIRNSKLDVEYFSSEIILVF